ncbi:MAG: pilus assembly protein [Acidimicrobiales bacterium]|jgi:hypothetical protein|nr:pilus assembly protein [Acidimicrobiales bacterium]
MMRRPRRPAPPRARGDDGTTLVEFAIVAPVFFLIVFGIIEFGLMYRDLLTTQDAVSDGARSAAIAANNLGALDDDPPPVTGDPPILPEATADFVTIKALRQGLGTIPVEWIEKIVIFRAQDPTAGSAADQVPQTCKDGVGTSGSGPNANPALNYVGACNVYDAELAFRAYESKNTDYFNCAESAGSPECNWPGIARVNDPVNPIAAPSYSGPDFVGVYVEISRPYLTGLFGTQFDFSEAVITRLEPGVVD